MSDDTPTPKPAEDEDDDALPVKLRSRTITEKFSRGAIDYTVSVKLTELIPKEANEATVSLLVKGEDGDRIFTGVIATRVDAGKWDIGGALAGSVDLDDRRNWQVEFLGVVSWK